MLSTHVVGPMCHVMYAYTTGDVGGELAQLRVARQALDRRALEPGAHLVHLPLDPGGELSRGPRAVEDEGRSARHPVTEHVCPEAARLAGGARSAVERDREAALGVREGDVDRVLDAAPLDDVSARLGELVLAELDLDRADHRDGHDGDPA